MADFAGIDPSEVPFSDAMGVPITFLDKYCPDQFEILGCSYQYGDPGCHMEGKGWGPKVRDRNIYKRIFIRRKRQAAS